MRLWLPECEIKIIKVQLEEILITANHHQLLFTYQHQHGREITCN